MKFFYCLASTCCGIALSSLPDISISSNDWVLPPEANITDDVLVINGDVSRYVKATLEVPISFTVKELYFVAQVRLDGMVNSCGSEIYKRPKLKVYDADSEDSIQAANLPIEYDGRENLVGVVISNFKSLVSGGLKKLRLEFGIQNCGGTFSARSAALLDQSPPPQLDYPFAPVSDTKVTIDVASLGSSLYIPGIISVNEQQVFSPFSFEDKHMADLLATIRLPQMRFPGGTVGNYYNWQTDSFYDDEYARASPGRAKAIDRGFEFGFEGYVASMKATNASSVLMFNVIEDSAETSVARLQDSLAHGLTIDYVEMGNENYDPNQGQGRLHGSDVNAYIAVTKELSAALKAVAPGLKTAVNMQDSSTYASGTWEDALSRESHYDAVTLHAYVNAGSAIFNLASARTWLSADRILKDRIAKYHEHFSQPLLLTEWGILHNDDVLAWMRVLSEVAQFTTILGLAAEGLVAQAGKHILFGNMGSYEALFVWNGTAIVAQPGGVWYRKFVDALRGSKAFLKTSLTAPELDLNLPAATAAAVLAADGTVRVFAVNKMNAPSEITINLDGLASKALTCEAFGASLDAWPIHDINDNPWSDCSTANSGMAQIPALSVAVITIEPRVTISV